MQGTKDLHILLRDLPTEADKALNTLSALKNVPKWTLIRQAVIEYAERHKSEIDKLVKKAMT